jgi:hypothetical protein
MKTLFSITLILIFVFCAIAQETKTTKEIQEQAKKLKNGGRYHVKYDRFEDRTVAVFTGFNLITGGEQFAAALAGSMGGYGRASSIPMLMLGAGFYYHGETLHETPNDYAIFFNYSADSWKFLKNSKLIAMIDDNERIQFGEGEVDRDIKFQGVQELVIFKASKEDMQKLADAKKLEIKIGNLERKLKTEHIQMFADVLKLGDVTLKAEKK